MFFWRAAVLTVLAASVSTFAFAGDSGKPSFIHDVPPAIKAKLTSTNETTGSFVQTKTLPSGESFECRGTYRIRPGVDFEWRVTDPFDSLFRSDLKTCVYSNEDECVERRLDALPGFSRFEEASRGDFAAFFKAFDVLYKEESGSVFHMLAKPKDSRLARFLSRVEADGRVGDWTLNARFPDGTAFKVRFTDSVK